MQMQYNASLYKAIFWRRVGVAMAGCFTDHAIALDLGVVILISRGLATRNTRVDATFLVQVAKPHKLYVRPNKVLTKPTLTSWQQTRTTKTIVT
jgi:hypothetical protein